MPTRDFFRRLSELVRGGSSTAAIGRQLRSERFRIGNDRLRAIVNRIRGRRITARQGRELITITTSLSQVPSAVEFRLTITARYAVARSEFGRGSETLLSGTVTSNETLTIPFPQGTDRLIETQAAALVEERVNERVREAGLARAGDYIEPQLSDVQIKITNQKFVNFV